MNDLYAAVVHDVKNQLAELSLRLGARSDTQQEMVIAMNAARRLTDMLLLHRQDNNLLSVNSDSVNAVDFLSILAAEYRALFPKIDIEVAADSAPVFSFFDNALVNLALGNALHNACRFAQAKVKLSAYEKDRMLVLEVSDDGDGYPQSLLTAGGMNPAAVSGQGTGLGIYLARKIAELHRLEDRNGYVELSNAGGAVFRMLLP